MDIGPKRFANLNCYVSDTAHATEDEQLPACPDTDAVHKAFQRGDEDER